MQPTDFSKSIMPIKISGLLGDLFPMKGTSLYLKKKNTEERKKRMEQADEHVKHSQT